LKIRTFNIPNGLKLYLKKKNQNNFKKIIIIINLFYNFYTLYDIFIYKTIFFIYFEKFDLCWEMN